MATVRPPVRVLAPVSVAFPALVVPPAVGLLTGVVLRAAAPAAAVPIPVATTVVVVVVVRSTITVALRLATVIAFPVALPIPVPIPASIAVRSHVPLSECSSVFTGTWTGTPLQDGQTTHLSLLSATLSALWLVVGMARPAGVAISPPVGPAYIGVQVQVQDHRRRRV